MNLPSINDLNIANKNILVRADLDDAFAGSPRLVATQNIIQSLQDKNAARIKVIGHNGSVEQTALGVDINWDLRADPREEANDLGFAKELAMGFDIYINEAFATSHRSHASIVALPQYFKQNNLSLAAGPRFIQEVNTLSKVFDHSGKKVLVIGGAKSGDKAQYAESLKNKFDVVLKGGLLPGIELTTDGMDISQTTIDDYKKQISNAVLIVVAGPMGKYEDVPHGTEEVFSAVANSSAFKIAGGGDTEAALVKFSLTQKFDWISVGGGAMLEFLATGTLPGIEALVA